jgi:CRISPR-associated endonuclease/helicase Cas3
MDFPSLFRAATGLEPFPYQTRLAQADPLPDLLSVPTGAGKTAAAVLSWVWRRRFAPPPLAGLTPRRLVICLPMRVLVEQTAGGVQHWLERLGLSGEIGVHVLMGGSVDDRWDAHPARDAVLIGTQDQLLSRALNRGYAMSRFRWPMHFAWLNSDCLWVVDETQLMGPGLSTSAQLQGFREHLSAHGTRTLWMSATLDERRLRTVDFRARPLHCLALDDDDRASPQLSRRLTASKPIAAASTPFDPKDLRALAAEVLATHRPGTRTLVVVNRVRRAQDLTAALRSSTAAVDVRLVHSRFRPVDRRETERVALAESFDGILVATQAVEAGVDISAATLFTELASWSAMVQRFGRCNRYGEYAADQVSVRWLDLPDAESLPYTEDDFAFSRNCLAGLGDVGPARLGTIEEPSQGPSLPVIRRRDLLDLFDTTADLSGHDLDVSQYIRDADDGSDAQIGWRDFGDDGPDADAPALQQDELCRVRAGDLRKLDLWRWDSLLGTWTRTKSAVPGQSYLVRSKDGRYDPMLGWTDSKTAAVPAVPISAAENLDFDAADPDTQLGQYVRLDLHAGDTADAMEALLEDLGEVGAPAELLVRAARWHDQGKVHPVFQAAIVYGLPADAPQRDGGPWAKSDRQHGGRYDRPHFRHELASALAALEHGEPDLLCYLVAAHHGKVRTAIRSRPTERPTGDERLALGVVEGDLLPAVDLGAGLFVPETRLRLDVMELGEVEERPTWASRVAGLLAEFGPFRLAYLEALVRAADWQASRLRDRSDEQEVVRG